MNLSSPITDNISELLIKVLKFTRIRQEIIVRNINDMHNPGFIPKDLEVDEFCNQLNGAIQEHLENGRLVLCDTENIKFGTDGYFKIKPVNDENAAVLLEEEPDTYIEFQINKILENSLNQRIASELLKQKQGHDSVVVEYLTNNE